MVRAALMMVALFPLAVCAQGRSYRIDSAGTRAEFEVDHLGVFRAHGKFVDVSGTLSYDAAAQSGAIDLAIPTASVATGWDSRDSFLRGTTMFDAAQFPRMRFVSRRFEFDGGRVVRVDGDLTLRAVTKPVSLTVHSMHCEGDT
jgi:polyisoprenoid-binding protein YceI